MKANYVGQRLEIPCAAPLVDIYCPDGSMLRWPTFEFQPHRLDPGEPHAVERAIACGELDRRLRFTPTQAGTYRIGDNPFEVQAAPFAGYLRFGPNGQHFARENGELFFPIGANFCWSNMNGVFTGQKLEDLFLMLRKLRDAGGNAYRLWANATWAGLTIDWEDPADGKPVKFGDINQAGCAKLDAIVAESERLGLGIMFCIDNMNVWAGGHIQKSSYWHENGGPCHSTWDYFNHPEARAMTREKMKYIAARWADSPAIWCWELWNEIDGCGIHNVTPHSMLAWHQEMAQALRAADPVQHPITTSTGHPLDFPPMWRTPEMEFTQTHHYGYKDSVDDIVPFLRGYHQSAMELWGKPHLFGELGISWCGPGYAGGNETDGRTLHNVIWSSALLPGSCGAGLYWSWDGYIHQNDLYSRFTGLAKFLEGERWHEQSMQAQPIELTVDPRTESAALIRQYQPPVNLKVPTCLSATDYVQSIFTIRHDGSVVEGNHLIPNLFHGIDHPTYRFRVTLRVNYAEPGEFTIMVWGGGANLSGGGEVKAMAAPVAEIRLDGQVAFSREVLTEKVPGVKDDYTDRLVIRVPAGPHEISIENVGGGVFHTGHYLLENYLEQRTLADAQAVRVGDQVYIWIRNTEFNWATPNPEKRGGLILSLPGCLPNAALRVEWWDTQTGTVRQTDFPFADKEGNLTLAVPEFHHDVAAKVYLLK